jgi:hypothetical protein
VPKVLFLNTRTEATRAIPIYHFTRARTRARTHGRANWAGPLPRDFSVCFRFSCFCSGFLTGFFLVFGFLGFCGFTGFEFFSDFELFFDSNFFRISKFVYIQNLFELNFLFTYEKCSNANNVQIRFLFICVTCSNFKNCSNLFRSEICSYLKFVHFEKNSMSEFVQIRN